MFAPYGINHPNAPPSPDAGGGLSAAEAARRLAANGANELPGGGPRGLPSIVGGVVTEPMFLLLLAAAGIYVVLGDVREALVLAASILIVITITVLQERRSENALARLRDLTSPRALVIRDAIEQRIAGREVVVGDLILLREGDRVPADAVVSAATALSIDESIVTGESLPVDKEATASSDSRDATHLVFSGTLIVRVSGACAVSGVRHRSRLLVRVRIRSGSSRCDAPETTPAQCPPVLGDITAPQPPARYGDSGVRGSHIRSHAGNERR